MFENKPFFRKGPEGKMYALGVTDDGRYLFVVFRRKPRGVVRVITARDMEPKEKRLYRRR